MAGRSRFVCVLLLFALNYACDGADDKVNSTFQPTNEWQKIEKGQSIPPGLHVRINLQTGYAEAKIPEDKTDAKEPTSLSLASEESAGEKDAPSLSRDQLARIMKNIKSDEGSKPGNSVAGKFRSYEELKKEFNELNTQIKTDGEIIRGLLENFKKLHSSDSKSRDADEKSKESQDKEILSNLVDLEYLVHHYDNGIEFAKLNGFSAVIHKCLNSSNGEIRSKALGVHGSATQSNPKVQIAALDSGSMNLLLKILTLDVDVNVRAKSMYALSCLVRGFPAAQQKLIADGGLTVFADIFDEEKQDLFQLQIKIVALIYDLMYERKDAKTRIADEESKNQTDAELNVMKERLRQYERMKLEQKLVEQNWCKRISNWIVRQNFLNALQESKNDDQLSQSPTLYIHDVVERVSDIFEIMSDVCITQFRSERQLLATLGQVSDVYGRLAQIEANNDEDILREQFENLHNRLRTFVRKLEETPPRAKEEL